VVELAVVPHEAPRLVVCGSSLRKPANILRAYLQSLGWQVAPRNVQFLYMFVDDGLEPDARALVDAFVAERGGQVATAEKPPADWTDSHPVSHQWSDSAMQRVGRHKDLILNGARQNRAEAVWLVDADLILDPMTFASLWSVPEQIVCGTYWTKWAKPPAEAPPVHAGPQVWMVHPYTLSGGGLEEWELRQKLIDRQVVQVFGQGACTLIRQGALAKGVSFAPVPENTGAGLMQGEDRHFCIRAEMLHIRMVADGWPDIFHVYHRPDDELLIPEWLDRFEGRPQDNKPQLGDLVSLDLTALEPVPTAQGWMHAPPQQVRGRLGKLALHPELEQAVLGMSRGDVQVVPVHFPLSYPFPPYRGQRRLIRLTLIDHKPMGFQPVIESEILANDIGSWVDTTTLTPDLVENLREVHAA
jgi:hypothetical protein